MGEAMPQRQVLSTPSIRACESIPWGSRTDSAFPRTIKTSLGDRNERRTAESSGFSKPAQMTLDSRLRRFGTRGGGLVAADEPAVVADECRVFCQVRWIKV